MQFGWPTQLAFVSHAIDSVSFQTIGNLSFFFLCSNSIYRPYLTTIKKSFHISFPDLHLFFYREPCFNQIFSFSFKYIKIIIVFRGNTNMSQSNSKTLYIYFLMMYKLSKLPLRYSNPIMVLLPFSTSLSKFFCEISNKITTYLLINVTSNATIYLIIT